MEHSWLCSIGFLPRRGRANDCFRRRSVDEIPLGARRTEPMRVRARGTSKLGLRVLGTGEDRPDPRGCCQFDARPDAVSFRQSPRSAHRRFREDGGTSIILTGSAARPCGPGYGPFDCEAELSRIQQPLLLLGGPLRPDLLDTGHGIPVLQGSHVRQARCNEVAKS